ITLAGILTLPTLMPDGSPFPARDLAIVIAMGVILMSLVIASIGLPLLTRGIGMIDTSGLVNPIGKEGHARTAAAEAAIRRLERIIASPLPDRDAEAIRAEAAAHVLNVYRRRLDYGDKSNGVGMQAHDLAETERQLRLSALAAEREELYQLRRTQKLDDSLVQKLVREIDLMEA